MWWWSGSGCFTDWVKILGVGLPIKTTAAMAMTPVGDTTGTEEEQEEVKKEASLDFFRG